MMDVARIVRREGALIVLTALLGLLPFGGAAFAEELFRASRPFQGIVTQSMAERAAETAARSLAMHSVVRELIVRPDVQAAGKMGVFQGMQPDLLPLAHAVAGTRVADTTLEGAPPQWRAVVAVALNPGDRSAAIRDILVRPERLALYARAVADEQRLLAAYDALAGSVLDTEARLAASESEPLAARAQALIAGLQAVDDYRSILPLWDGVWKDPALVLSRMQKALTMDGENALLYNALGEALSQLGRFHEAQEVQTRAIRLEPSLARAHHARGVAYLAQNLPSLAVADFSEAIRLAPASALYRRDRAAAWLVLADTPRMCRDLYDACARGDCARYRQAREQGACPGSLTETTP